MSTKGKTWVARKSVRKAFDAAVEMRRRHIQMGLKHIHAVYKKKEVWLEEFAFIHRNVQKAELITTATLTEELIELDDILLRLSKHL